MKNTYHDRLEKLMREAIEELHKINIFPAESITGIKANSRAKRRLVFCKRTVNRGVEKFEIEISTILEGETDQRIKEIIHHELLHTCKGCLNHGQKWKSLAARVNNIYGYHIRTTAEIPTLDDGREKPYRYEIRCTKCGNTGYRMKKSRVVKEPGNYRCSKCGGQLSVKEKSFWN